MWAEAWYSLYLIEDGQGTMIGYFEKVYGTKIVSLVYENNFTIVEVLVREHDVGCYG